MMSCNENLYALAWYVVVVVAYSWEYSLSGRRFSVESLSSERMEWESKSLVHSSRQGSFPSLLLFPTPMNVASSAWTYQKGEGKMWLERCSRQKYRMGAHLYIYI